MLADWWVNGREPKRHYVEACEHIYNERIGYDMASEIEASGYAIVKLPEPDSTRYEGDEHEPMDRLAWGTGGKFAVSHWEYPEVQVAYDGEPFEPISIEEARAFAAALLAAADAAEEFV